MKVVLITLFAVAVVLGCGLGMPPPTDKTVSRQDIQGSWEYSGLYPEHHGLISFAEDGTFSLVLSYDGKAASHTNSGQWSLDGAFLDLAPFWTTSDTQGVPTRHETMRWWVTAWHTDALAPFGGDSADPDHWMVLSRAKKQPKSVEQIDGPNGDR